jgi:ABC-type transport system involved in multi-copper enzyme maturation permease subunit
MLTLFSVAIVALTSRSLAGEVDRGTVDLLLACPVPRSLLVLACIAALSLVTALFVSVVWWGMRLGLWLAGIDAGHLYPALYRVGANLACLFLAFAAVSLLVSATTSERGKATGRAIAFIVLSFFINLIANLWGRVEWLDTISLFHYYQPMPILTSGTLPPGDVAVLLAVAVTAFAASLFWFCRRDIATV